MGELSGSERSARASAGLARAFAGLLLIGIVWPLNWMLSGLRTHVLFFPLWLGYVLFVDGLTEIRSGDSLCARSRRGFAGLFLVSVPLWWVFELANERLGNWEYLGGERFSDLEYALFGTLSFCTVAPAVLASAELVRSSRWVESFARGPRVRPTRGLLAGLFVAGAVLFVLMIVWPRAFYPLLWVSGVFLLEPLARWRGRRSLLDDLERGDWRPWVSLWAGGLLCGFFWEMWNVYSYPKWIYHTPGVGDPRLFEMPLLGYLGYLPFALEVFLFKEHLVRDPELRL